MTDFRPEPGDDVVLEIADGIVVRDPLDFHKLKTGDRVRWSTYFARRQRDGALVPKPKPAAKRSKRTAPPTDEGGDEGESK